VRIKSPLNLTQRDVGAVAGAGVVGAVVVCALATPAHKPTKASAPKARMRVMMFSEKIKESTVDFDRTSQL
jgi:hypothetical protein